MPASGNIPSLFLCRIQLRSGKSTGDVGIQNRPRVREWSASYYNNGYSPSWHLYSQFLKEGGPHQPDLYIFNQSDDYLMIGKAEENGKSKKFYDDIYEMDVIWYSGVVIFFQKIRMNKPVTTIKGKVECMACNNESAFPVCTNSMLMGEQGLKRTNNPFRAGPLSQEKVQ